MGDNYSIFAFLLLLIIAFSILFFKMCITHTQPQQE